jgi:hypothetical protein
MACVLETCDTNAYIDAHGQLEWENSMANEHHYLVKNDTWDLVPQLQGKNVVKCQ